MKRDGSKVRERQRERERDRTACCRSRTLPSTFLAFACLYFCFMPMIRNFFRLRVDVGSVDEEYVIIRTSRSQWVIDQTASRVVTPGVKNGVRYRVYRVAY